MKEKYAPYFPEQPVYDNRSHAGASLARGLARYRRRKTLLVLAIREQGIEVGLPIAQSLRAPLDFVLSCLLPIPGRPEAAFGAVTGDTFVLNDGLAAAWGLRPEQIRHIVEDARDRAQHRMHRIRGARPLPEFKGKTIIVADDGQGVGFPIIAAVEWLLRQKPRAVVVAIPVAPRHDVRRLTPLISEVVCPIQIDAANISVAGFYRRWDEPTEDRLAAMLRQQTFPSAA